ncbi:hypothetical protein ACKWTF_001263 [Chironomus riparius]
MQNVSNGIQRRIAKWTGLLTVEFEKLFPNILNGAKVAVDTENFLATCPLCHLSYSIIYPSRNNTLCKRNFVDHLKRRHLQIRNPSRLSAPPPISTSVPDNSSTLDALSRNSLLIQLDFNHSQSVLTPNDPQIHVRRLQTRTSRRSRRQT